MTSQYLHIVLSVHPVEFMDVYSNQWNTFSPRPTIVMVTHPAGLIQEVQDPQLALNEVDARLVVVEVDE